MERLVIALDPGVEVRPAELAAAWDSDDQARTVGAVTVETAPPGDFFGVIELVVIPLAVNLASEAAFGLVSRLINKVRRARLDQPDIEISELAKANGDRVIVVRQRGTRW